MVLTKYIKPFVSSFGKEKWKSRNIQTRKKAVQELPVSDQQIIADIALNDSDESIKIIAINKSSDLDLLQTIIMKGTSPSIKKAAEIRFYQLLSGIKHPIPDYKDREKIIHGSRNPALLEFIAENAAEPEFRQLAIKRINRDALLGNIALKDTHADVRLAAAQQIAKRSTLERVVKQARRKDKRVYKTVKAKLDNIIEDEERPLLLAKEVEDICYQLERLYKRGRLLQEKPTFENYMNRWESIKNFASEENQQRYSNACEQIFEGIDALEHEKVRQQETLSTLENILAQVSDSVDELLQARDNQDNTLISRHENSLSKLRQTWQDTIGHLTNEQAKPLNSRFQTLLALTQSSASASNGQSVTDTMMVLCSQIESMLNSKDHLGKHAIDALDSKFHAQLKLLQHHTAEIDKCIDTFEQSLSSLRERLHIQCQKAEELKGMIITGLEQIQVQIDEGQISTAEKHRNNLYNQIDKSQLLSTTEKQQYQKKLNKFRIELGEFSSWRNWAHENEREHLAQQAEQLLIATQEHQNLEHAYLETVDQVKTLRQSWKRLKSPSSDDLWERFNNACSQTYELCTPFLKKEAQARDAHLHAKEALCAQLEQYIESMGWPNDANAEIDPSIDWIKVDQITRQARKEWNAIGFVDRKAHKTIRKRFDKNINIIRSELKKAWNLNQDKFYHLINEVKELHQLADTDLDQAIQKAKLYQKEWKTIGPVPAFQRNKLWKKFRKNCDLIFNKRQDIIDQRNQDNEVILREKEAICENFEALNQQPLSITDLQNAYHDIAKLWRENEPKLRSLSKKLNHRYNAAKTEYDNKLALLIAEQKAQQLELFKHKAQLCTQMERLSTYDSDEIEKITARWDELPKLPAKMEKLIKTRFNNAQHNLTADRTALIQAESENKQQLCLKYEILMGKESPEEQQQARREMQVKLLNSSMSGRQDEPDPMEMQLQWHSLSNYEYEGDAEIDERFSRLV